MPSPNSIFWGGYGGSLAIIDMDARTTFGYAMNKMAGTTTGDTRAFGLAMAMWDALGKQANKVKREGSSARKSAKKKTKRTKAV